MGIFYLGACEVARSLQARLAGSHTVYVYILYSGILIKYIVVLFDKASEVQRMSQTNDSCRFGLNTNLLGMIFGKVARFQAN